MAVAMKTAAIQRLRPVPASEVPVDLDRVLAPVLARLAALERQVEALMVTRTVTATDPVIVKIEELKAACLDLAIFVTWDGHVTEADAARLLGKAAQHPEELA